MLTAEYVESTMVSVGNLLGLLTHAWIYASLNQPWLQLLDKGQCSNTPGPTPVIRHRSGATSPSRWAPPPSWWAPVPQRRPAGGAADPTTDWRGLFGACLSRYRSSPTRLGHARLNPGLSSSCSSSISNSLCSCRPGNSSQAPAYLHQTTGIRYVIQLLTIIVTM